MKQLEHGAHVKVGILQSKGGGAAHDGISMVELAAIHEFGSPAAGIPRRSFIYATFQVRKTRELVAITSKLAKKVIAGGMSVEHALGVLGIWGAAAVKKTIRDKLTIGPDPQANSPATIAAKKSATPLVDTGRLINAVAHEVKL